MRNTNEPGIIPRTAPEDGSSIPVLSANEPVEDEESKTARAVEVAGEAVPVEEEGAVQKGC